MSPIEANIMIDGWTMAERQILQAELMKLSIGQFKLDGELHTSCISLSGEVEPKQTSYITQRCYVTMKVGRLVILEPSYEHIEREYVQSTFESKWNWFRRRTTRELTPQRTIEHSTIRTVPRSAWRVRSMFFGADAAFPTEQSISGDLFTPDGPYGPSTGFGSVISCGIDATLCVENTTSQRLQFNAVLIGTTKPNKRNEEMAAV